MTFVRP
jgi:hypothetical protein